MLDHTVLACHEGGTYGDVLSPYVLSAIDSYVLNGTTHGRFVMALLEGDLFKAVSYGDAKNLATLRILCLYLWNETAPGCFGSPEAVSAWIEKGGLNGVRAEEATNAEHTN